MRKASTDWTSAIIHGVFAGVAIGYAVSSQRHDAVGTFFWIFGILESIDFKHAMRGGNA